MSRRIEGWQERPEAVVSMMPGVVRAKSILTKRREVTPIATSAPRDDVLQTRLQRTEDFDRDHALSWLHCMMSLCSYTLLLTDIVRSGIGMRRVSQSFPPIEPDSYSIFGPYAYPVTHLTVRNATANESTDFWPYKYDSTSIGMRAIAQFLELPTWSPCVLYKKRCDESTGINRITLFRMIDTLVGGVAARSRSSRGHLTLRAECNGRDRLHQYAFPWFFQMTLKRTNQAVYGSFNTSTFTAATTAVCQRVQANRRPYSCSEQWTHLQSQTRSRSKFRAWNAIMTHFKKLVSAYPDHLVDYTILDSTEDPSRGALSFQGRRYFDIVVLARVRKCVIAADTTAATASAATPWACTTVAVDDYRYEGGSFIMDAPAWFPVVATLRVVGQTYTWLRVGLLISSCYLVQSRHASVLKRVRSTVRTFFLVPSQIVIYGSPFPITLYAVAHLIDSPASYEIIHANFNTWFGQLTMDWGSFLHQCAVSMRSVWILGVACHASQAITTSCSWSQSRGVLGMTELSITLLASVTMFAKYRSVTFRNNEVIQVHEVTASGRRHEVLRNLYQQTPSTLTSLLFGSTVDRQCLLFAFLALLTIIGVLRILNRLSPALFPFRVALFSRTLVPYSAGTLWSCSRLVVSWYSTIVQRVVVSDDMNTRGFHQHNTSTSSMPATFRSIAVAALAVDRQVRTDMRVNGLVVRRTHASELIRRDLLSVYHRSRHVQSMIKLLNLAVMTDPMTFLLLRKFRGQQVGLYEYKPTRCCYLLPVALQGLQADVPIEWREFALLAVVNTRDLDWNDLLLCG